jgi:hypothetical protein
MLKNNMSMDDVLSTPKPHITVLYGFRCSEWKEIDALVNSWKINEDDYTFGDARFGDVSPVIMLPVMSARLTALFGLLSGKYPDNKHTLINGNFSPHVTLAWLKRMPVVETVLASAAEPNAKRAKLWSLPTPLHERCFEQILAICDDLSRVIESHKSLMDPRKTAITKTALENFYQNAYFALASGDSK